MANSFAFFPWVYVDEPQTFGSVRLLPYGQRKLPGNLDNITQTDMDGVLRAYSNRPNHLVRKCTILEFGDWHAGMDAERVAVVQAFRIRNMIAFSALSNRKLFQQFGYCNYDTYKLIFQRYQPGETGTFAFTTRRRDGSTNYLWGSDEFAFHRPIHVDENSRLSVDEPLLLSLLSLPEAHESIYESIIEFNSANTDSLDVPEHVEIVMCKSAFEWLLGVDEKSKSIVAALKNSFKDIDLLPGDGPLKDTWLNRWPNSSHILYAWACDFCAARGDAAHGKAKKHHVWKPHQHLAFISFFFPLLLKKVLADVGLFTMDDYDLERLRCISEYLSRDPFDFDWRNPNETHPWVKTNNHAYMTSRWKTINK